MFPFLWPGNLMPGKPPVECGEGFYVLGDDSGDSLDSRYEGIVMRDQVIGRAWLIVGPSGRRGFVNPQGSFGVRRFIAAFLNG